MDDSYQLTAFLAVNNLSDLSWSMQIYSIHSLIELFSIPQRHLSHMFGTVRSAQLKVALEKFEKTRSTAKGARQRSLSSSFHAQRSDKLVSTTDARTSSPSIHIEVESRDLGVPDTGKMIRFWSARGSLAKQKTDAKSSPTTPLDVREAKKGNTITRFDHSGGFANTSEIRVRPLTPQPESKRIVEPFRRVSSMRSVRDGQKKVGAYIKKIPSPESKREVPLRTSIDPIEARSTSPLASNQPPTRINNVATRMMRSKSNDMACRSPHVRPASKAIPASQIQSKHQCLRKEDEKKIKSIPHMRPWGASSNRSNSVLPPARRKVPVPSSQGNSKTPADANQHLSPVIRRVAPRSNIERTKKTIGSGFNNTGTALHTSNAPTRQKSGDMEILSGVIRLKFSPEKPSLQRNLQTCRVRENNKGVLPRRGDTTANMWADRSLSPPFQASPHRSAEERGRRGVQPQPELKSKKDPNVVDGTRLRYGRPRPNMISPTAVGSRSPFGRRPPTTTESAHQPRVTESSRLSASNLRIHTLSCTQYPDLPTLISPGVVRRVIHDPYHAEETGNAIEAPVFHLEPKVWKLYAKVNPEVNKQHLERFLAKQSDLESSGRKNSGVDTTEETTDPQFGKLSLDNTVQDMVDCEVPFEARLSRVVSQSRFLHFREEKQEEILALLGYHPELHSVLIQLLRESQRSPSSDPKKLSVQASRVYAI